MFIELKGKPVADEITGKVKAEVEKLVNKGITPKLMIIRVGENPSDMAYERGALKRMDACGIEAEVMALDGNITEEAFAEKLDSVNKDEKVHGILIFRPLAKQINEDRVKYIISNEKDVDCFSPVNAAKVMEGDESGFYPATPSAVLAILKHYKVPLAGKHAVVIGRSMVVGKPVSMMLLKENATVTICHSKTENLKEICRTGDIIIAAVGKDRMVDESYIKEGAVVIDVGINVDDKGDMWGDADYESCKKKVSMITPVPGGVGSVTTSILAQNVLKACLSLNSFNL
jgi:methylenetetrahydrofolate dehydrogenase (NADP+)/methenyltetrahydrofolate cyclohydrolase